jgi:hypothetical protein
MEKFFFKNQKLEISWPFVVSPNSRHTRARCGVARFQCGAKVGFSGEKMKNPTFTNAKNWKSIFIEPELHGVWL